LAIGPRLSWLSLVVASVGALACVACGTSKSDLTCGDGTQQQGDRCVVAPGRLDASAEAEASAPADASAPVDADVPPVFAGVAAVAPVSASQLLAAWRPGTAHADPPAALRYRVYVAPADQALSYETPAAITAPGAVSAVVSGLQADTAYVIGVRAVDPAGVDDGNTITRTGTTAVDTTPPTFAGLASAAPGGSGAVALAWDAAHDDRTDPAAITYLVYQGDVAGGEDFTAPVLVSAPGATSALVTRLPNAQQARYFVVRARDAAGNVDTNTVEQASTPGLDSEAPQFAGCSAATTLAAETISVSWAPAVDDVSAPADLAYEVYASTKPGSFDFTRPFAIVKGQDVAVLSALEPSTRYSFVCRAKDEAGNEDTNAIEVHATTGANPVPPTFGGITGLTGDPAARTATLSWTAGMDAMTPQSQLLYDVYVAEAAGAEAFDKPPLATSAPGATSTTVSGLMPNTTLFFVVRARDSDGNHDGNTVEKSMVTNASFALNVQPIFTHDCAVVGCHVPGSPTGNLVLSPGFAYARIVGILAPEANGILADGGSLDYVTPGDPNDSFLNIKTNATVLAAFKATLPPANVGRIGTQMPAPSTGSTLTQAELATIANWIAQGAPNN
jgi:hypothetical protein